MKDEYRHKKSCTAIVGIKVKASLSTDVINFLQSNCLALKFNS